MMKKKFAALLLAMVAPAAAAASPLSAESITGPLTVIADGQDKAFGTAVAPAQSLDAGLARGAQIHAVIARIAGEVEAVTTAFATATAAERISATKAAVARFNPETARDGASRSFEGEGPSLSLMRQLLFVPTKNGAISSDAV